MVGLGKFIGSMTQRWSNSPVLRNSVAAFALRITGAVLLFAFNFLIVRLLGVSDSGVFFLAMTIINIVGTLLLLGIDQLTLRKLSAVGQSKSESSRHIFIISGQLLVISSVVGAAIVAVLSGKLGDVFSSTELSDVILILSLSLPFLNLSALLGETLRAKKKFAYSVFITTNSLYVIAIPVFVVFGLTDKASLRGVATGFFVSTIFCLLVNTLLFRKNYPLRRARDLAASRHIASYTKTLMESYHLFWVSALYLSMAWIDILIVGFFLPPDQVSIYSIASKIAKLMTFPLFAINTIIAPRISASFSRNDKRALNIESQKSTLLSIAFSLPLLLVFMAFPAFLMGIFGDEFRGSSGVLRILVLGQAINCFTGAVIVILTMIKQERKVNLISFVGISLQIVLGIVLTPRYGMTGMALATLVGGAVLNISGALILLRSHGINVVPGIKLVKQMRGSK
jgi:O-antigen/teichoic acid export membrane protein